MNPDETNNLYFVTNTQERENIPKTVTTNPQFPIYTLVWNLLCILILPYYPLSLGAIMPAWVKQTTSYLTLWIYIYTTITTTSFSGSDGIEFISSTRNP